MSGIYMQCYVLRRIPENNCGAPWTSNFKTSSDVIFLVAIETREILRPEFLSL
jgi:hypothetical protein